jgi:hypothetical protein
MAFFSVSTDGLINYWVLNQHELGVTTIMTLFLDLSPIPGPDGTIITLKGTKANGSQVHSGRIKLSRYSRMMLLKVQFKCLIFLIEIEAVQGLKES